MLFFEKLNSSEDDIKYTPSNSFNLTRSRLSELAGLAEDLDKLASSDMNDIYGSDEIEAQRKILEDIEAKKGLETSQKESRKVKSEENPPLQSARTMCYTVAWFDGKVERFQSEVFQSFNSAMEWFKQVGR